MAMATIRCLSLHTGGEISKKQVLLDQIEQAEKKSFARHEAFDFHNQLKKRNLELVVVVDDAHNSSSQVTLVAYMVFAYMKPGNFVMLHKVCVRKECRRQGIAKGMLAAQVERLEKQGTAKIQLWVDDGKVAARRLYNCIGFEEVSRCTDYYAVGRVGVQMALSLAS